MSTSLPAGTSGDPILSIVGSGFGVGVGSGGNHIGRRKAKKAPTTAASMTAPLGTRIQEFFHHGLCLSWLCSFMDTLLEITYFNPG